MNPEEIKSYIESAFANIVSERRNNPDGWSFYFNKVCKGKNSSRIARTTQDSINSSTYFKLTVSARLKLKYETEIIDPNMQQVRDLFEYELELWEENFN